MKVMITGGAGFIAFHLANQLIDEGHTVCGFDNFNDYYDPALKRKRVMLLEERGIPVSEIDLKDADAVSRYVEEEVPDTVIHLGAYANPRHGAEFPELYLDNNCMGSLNLIRALEKHNIRNVIYASTSCVMHGNPLPWREFEMLAPQINPYGYSKMVNESQFAISTIPNAVGLRFFTVYGPWGRPDMALFDFTKKILDGNPITLYNYGDMKRDFTYVDDIVQGIILVMNNMTERDMYNIGRGEPVELERFVDAIETSLGVKAIREYGPQHPADAKDTWSDTTKLQKLGYNPQTSIEEGVNKFVQWYRRYHN